jgi:hypothetical protein
MASACEHAVCDLTMDGVRRLGVVISRLTDDLVAFMSDPDLRTHLRSATDCHFDLAHHVVPVSGGTLLHIVSDSQWVRHWLLYVGDDDETAVVTTMYPAGFELDNQEQAFWESEPWSYTVCAASFAEFLWRWWMDNEIFFRVIVDHEQVDAAQASYLRNLGQPSALD